MLGPITSTPCSLSFPQAIAPVPVLLLFPHLPHLASPSSFACACVLTLPVPFRCQIFLPPASPQELATDTGDTLLSHNHAIGTSLPFGATFDMAHYTHSAPFSHKGTEPSVITSNLFQGANSSTPDPAPPSPLSEFAASSIPQPCISVIVDFGPSIASGPGHMDVSDFDSSDYPSLDSEDNLEQDVVPPLPMHHTLLELPLPDSPLPSMSAFVSATQTPTALQHAINRSSQVSSTSFYTAPCTRDSKPPSLRSSLAATLGQTDAQGSTTSPITLLPPLLKARHKISISKWSDETVHLQPTTTPDSQGHKVGDPFFCVVTHGEAQMAAQAHHRHLPQAMASLMRMKIGWGMVNPHCYLHLNPSPSPMPPFIAHHALD